MHCCSDRSGIVPKICGCGNSHSNILRSRVVKSESPESPESDVLERSRSTFFRFDKVGVASKSRFVRFGGIGNQNLYCFRRLRFMLNYFTFLYSIPIFIILTRRKTTEALYVGQAITPICFEICQDIAVR